MQNGGKTRMLKTLLLCSMILEYQCQDYGKSECSSIYIPLDQECGEDLKAKASPGVIRSPSIDGIKEGYLRFCVWTITAKEELSIALNVIDSNFNQGRNCWPNFLKVYSGNTASNPNNEIFSVCSEHKKRRFQTGWNQVTVLFQVHESFRYKTFELQYTSYASDETTLVVSASFQEISSCSNRALTEGGEENSRFAFNWDLQEEADIFVHYCVYPRYPVQMHHWLMADPPYLAYRWQTSCNSTMCRIHQDNLIPPLNGQYTFSVRVGRVSASVTFQVILKNSPRLHTHTYTSVPYERGNSYHFDCDFLGVPVPEAFWFFYPARRVEDCCSEKVPDVDEWNTLRKETFNQSKKHRNSEGTIHYVCYQGDYRLRLFFTAEESGCLVCWTRNRFGSNYVPEPLPVTGPSGEFVIVTSETESIMDEMFSLTCTANSFDFGNLTWIYQKELSGVPVSQKQLQERDFRISFEPTVAETTIGSVLRFTRLSSEHEGYYTCVSDKTKLKYNSKESRYEPGQTVQQKIKHHINLKVITVPVFAGNTSSLRNDTVRVKVLRGTNVTLNCSSRGMKPLNYEWKRVSSDGREVILQGHEKEFVVISDLQATEAQVYECTVSNDAGNLTRCFYLESVSGDTGVNQEEQHLAKTIALSSVGTILLILIVGTVLVLHCRKKLKEEKNRRKFIFLPPRSSGPIEVNIPLDVAWEFPDQRLLLEEKIGHGAYGKVVKAKAFGISPKENVTTVAVKMLKANANASHKKALFAELKILISLGHHLNVVNLLGAVTKHQNQGKLMIIVEYCERGCLLKVLQEQRKTFVCQVHQDTGRLDKKLRTFPFQKSVSIKYSTSSDRVTTDSGSTSTATDEKTASSSAKTNESCITDEPITQESLVETTTNQDPLSTMDLIKFSFQCARGMEYIASRKLVHRDLAARNVLLTKDNIIKICDFGLTRDEIYLYNNIKRSALPVRWMAPESLGQNQFTTKSDVWSFGILLWEMFTLGDNPYPGMPIDHEFYQGIFNGYRLEPPETTPEIVAKLMLDCWQVEPGERPFFSQIVEIFSELLEKHERNYYLVLDAPYAAANRRNSRQADVNSSSERELLSESLFEADNSLYQHTDDKETHQKTKL